MRSSHTILLRLRAKLISIFFFFETTHRDFFYFDCTIPTLWIGHSKILGTDSSLSLTVSAHCVICVINRFVRMNLNCNQKIRLIEQS